MPKTDQASKRRVKSFRCVAPSARRAPRRGDRTIGARRAVREARELLHLKPGVPLEDRAILRLRLTLPGGGVTLEFDEAGCVEQVVVHNPLLAEELLRKQHKANSVTFDRSATVLCYAILGYAQPWWTVSEMTDHIMRLLGVDAWVQERFEVVGCQLAA